MNISLSFHIIGIVFWIGGLLLVTRFMRLFSESGQTANTALAATVRKGWFIYVIHGLLFTLLSGFYQFFTMGAGEYMKQGWFHGKLTFIFVLLITTSMAGLEVRKVGLGQNTNPGRLRLIQILSAISFVAIVFMTKVMRG
ncbi:MAG: CopD family protein [Oligoflexia bacterium]|nr:CopD family protein [Oligoflexia bacterium]